MSESRYARVGFIALAAAVVVFVAVLIWLSQRDTEKSSAKKGSDALAQLSDAGAGAAPTPGVTRANVLANGRPTWRPGMDHWYGDDPDPFIRQPQDYDMDTPKILGNRISYHVFDLETVEDMVRRGMEPDSEIARVRGEPLSKSEREDARQIIQKFFDDTVPEVDGMIAGTMNIDDGYDQIGPRRRKMNEDLRDTLGLSQDAFYKIWPHIKDLDDNIEDLREPTAEELAEREANQEP